MNYHNHDCSVNFVHVLFFQEACETLLSELQRDISTAAERGLSGADMGTSEDEAVSGFTLAIDGRTLDFALHEDLQKMFLDLTNSCRSVICCRSTPLQKSQVVRLVGDSLRVMTMAIGQQRELFPESSCHYYL